MRKLPGWLVTTVKLVPAKVWALQFFPLGAVRECVTSFQSGATFLQDPGMTLGDSLEIIFETAVRTF